MQAFRETVSPLDGSKIAKIEWKPKKNTEAPFDVKVPDTLQDVFFIEKNNKKYPATKGWAYAAFDYDPTSDTFRADKTGTVSCGFACHSGVAAKDYIFTAYAGGELLGAIGERRVIAAAVPGSMVSPHQHRTFGTTVHNE